MTLNQTQKPNLVRLLWTILRTTFKTLLVVSILIVGVISYFIFSFVNSTKNDTRETYAAIRTEVARLGEATAIHADSIDCKHFNFAPTCKVVYPGDISQLIAMHTDNGYIIMSKPREKSDGYYYLNNEDIHIHATVDYSPYTTPSPSEYTFEYGYTPRQ